MAVLNNEKCYCRYLISFADANCVNNNSIAAQFEQVFEGTG